MAIPDYQTCMFPLLKFASDNKEHSLREAIESLSIHFKLSDDELKELLPSGQQAIFVNRIGWARSYMKQAGLLETKRRGYFRITQRGLDVLSQNPEKIDVKFLEQYKEFLEFRKRKHTKSNQENEIQELQSRTPAELLETAYENLRTELASELLQQIKSNLPSLFEKIVVELLVKMGYGGSRKDAGRAIGKRGDEGRRERIEGQPPRSFVRAIHDVSGGDNPYRGDRDFSRAVRSRYSSSAWALRRCLKTGSPSMAITGTSTPYRSRRFSSESTSTFP